MSIEARLQALVQNYRAQYGDAALRAPAQMIANLSSQSPDLHGEIRALAAAIGGDAANRIAAAGANGDAEVARIATEIAGRERLSMAVATAGVAVARMLGPISAAAPAMPPAPSGGGGWAGESVVVQPAPQPAAYQPPPQQAVPPAYVPPGSAAPPGMPGAPAAQPIYKNPLAIGGAALVALFLFYQMGQNEQGNSTQNGQGRPGPVAGGGPQGGGPQGGPIGGGGPQGGGGTQGGGQQGGEPPTLAAPNAQQPMLRVDRQQDGSSAIYFRIQTERGPAMGAVGLPGGGWDGGTTAVGFSQPGDPSGRLTYMGAVQMQLIRAGQVTLRAGPVQWQQGEGLGGICIAFAAQGQQQDVPVSGSSLCVADASCQQPVACGRVQ